MSKEFKKGLLWLPAAGFVLLPCSVVLCLDLYPGTTYLDHVSSAAHLLAVGIILLMQPLPAQTLHAGLPREHNGQLRYALRSGVLPLASLFSDWREALAQRERAYSLALGALPAGSAAVILINVYGIFRDPAAGSFFLWCALATAACGVAAFAFSAVRLQNVYVVEGKLREQIELLDAHP